MCGIAGFFAPQGQDMSIIQDMCDVIEHRGPDDFGAKSFVVNNESQVGFGHRRLSIVDLSSNGHQPMGSQNDRYWITYNGEIYNYIELREELIGLGYSFKSKTDTEVILAAYEEWGIDCQNHFNGMWAFAVYDSQEKTIFLSRDRFGIKPLYYWVSPENIFYFGSEIKQFTVLPKWKAVLNHQRAYDFLVWGVTDHTEETMFDGVFHIPAGHYFFQDLKKLDNIALNKAPNIKWYNLPSTLTNISFEEASASLRELLKDSVNIRLRADVNVGSCLSGGLDSSAIVCLMSNILKDKKSDHLQKTFSACSNVQSVDEKKWIDLVVNHAKVDPYYTYPNRDDLFEKLDEIIWHQDEPFGSTSIFAQWEVFSLAKKNNTIVMLDGQGADEQLAGYHSFFGARLSDLLKSYKFVTFCTEAIDIHYQHGHSWLWILAQTASHTMPASIKNICRKILGRSHLRPSWLNFDALKVKPSNPHDDAEGVKDLAYAQMTATNLQMLLHWEDRDSMAHSIESRVPFLDYRLVENIMSLPSEYKIKGSVTKRVLRAAINGIVPNQIKDRIDKIGFATPEEVWITGETSDIFREKIQYAALNSGGIITASALNYFDDVVQGKKPFSYTIWRIINFAQWLRVFDVHVENYREHSEG